MAYPERLRKFYLQSQGEKCQILIYNERRGMHKCEKKRKPQVHHTTPEGWTKEHGGNPDETEGLVVCDEHHVRNIGREEYSEDFAFHSDIGHAYRSYEDYKQKKQHLELIRGKKISKRDLPSPFDETCRDHRQKAKRGERYHNGTPELDRYYAEESRDMATRYIAETGIKKPTINRKKPHKPKPTHWEWVKGLFDKDD